MEEIWGVDYDRKYRSKDNSNEWVSIHIITTAIPMEKRNLVEKAADSFFDQVREILG